MVVVVVVAAVVVKVMKVVKVVSEYVVNEQLVLMEMAMAIDGDDGGCCRG